MFTDLHCLYILWSVKSPRSEGISPIYSNFSRTARLKCVIISSHVYTIGRRDKHGRIYLFSIIFRDAQKKKKKN